jgi:hypothetical protein
MPAEVERKTGTMTPTDSMTSGPVILVCRLMRLSLAGADGAMACGSAA